MATQAGQQANPIAVIRQNLTAMSPELKAALPPHVSVEKFSRVTMTAIQQTPALMNADRRSLFGAVVRLAQDGLLPDGREAAIVMFGDKAQAMPMVAGILKKVRQSGELSNIVAHVVYEADDFIYRLGDDESIEHRPPPLDRDRGKPIGAYAVATLKDGSKVREVMTLAEIERVRAVSRSGKSGPWVAWWSEMARKTVIRRLSKRLPMSTDIEAEFERDETMTVDAAALAVVSTPASAPAAPASRLDALEHRIEAEKSGEDLDARAAAHFENMGPNDEADEPIGEDQDDMLPLDGEVA